MAGSRDPSNQVFGNRSHAFLFNRLLRRTERHNLYNTIMKRLFIGLFMLISVGASAQWATYMPQTTPSLTLPSRNQQRSPQAIQVTGYQYDSYANKWYRIGLKISVKEGLGRADIISVVGIREDKYWKDIQPLIAGSINDKESEFSYYINLAGGTVYFNY